MKMEGRGGFKQLGTRKWKTDRKKEVGAWSEKRTREKGEGKTRERERERGGGSKRKERAVRKRAASRIGGVLNEIKQLTI